MSYFYEYYNNQIVEDLKSEFDLKHIINVPKIKMISLNMGLGRDAVASSAAVESAARDLSLITGQKPVVTTAKNSIASFQIRKGMKLGCKVTLRGKKMYEFLDNLVFIALPRIRDFQGFKKKSFDGNGNFSFGLSDQSIFPGVDYNKIDKFRGFNINIFTSTNSDQLSMELLKRFHFPFNL
ncbi:MAG: 50S ribosomal protein L5 [Cyanobacteria bacterium P01_A01_bin.68]